MYRKLFAALNFGLLAAFLLAAGFAALDETHQTFVSSRTGTLVDVGWDSAGAAVGLIGRWVTLRQ